MLIRRWARILFVTGAATAWIAITGAAEWQWSVEVATPVRGQTEAPARAFLWIPPSCARVRAVVVGQQSLQEQPILEHARFRAALAELGFAAVWITPPFDPVFHFEADAGDRFNALMSALAKESGFAELAVAPIVPLGHSAAAAFPWNFATWNPSRTLAVISISGQWPYGDDAMPDAKIDPRLEGVPGLVMLGEYEWAEDRVEFGLRQRKAQPRLPLSMIGESGGGHFEVSPQKIDFLALYLKKAAQHRLPAALPESLEAAVPLSPVDATLTGWLVDRWRLAEPTRAQAAPLSEYPEPDDAFWCFDEEHAIAAEKYRMAERGKRVALLGYVQNGAIVPQVAGTHPQVTLPFAPLEDGISFRLGAAFLDTVPKGRPERWTGLQEGASVGHPAGGAPIAIDPICGPVVKVSHDTFALHFDRNGFNTTDGTAAIWLAATHPGDAQFKRAVQQALVRVPLRNTEGRPQQITFAPIADQGAGVKRVALSATSSAGGKVQFYVREGPAEVEGDTLKFTPLPARTHYPVKVTVVAWQYGRSAEPKIQSAEPVVRSFLLSK